MTSNQLSTQQKRDISTNALDWTFEDVKRYFDPQNLLTEKQVGQALSLIKGRNLNPLADEVYIVAYKNRNGGTEFSLIVSKEAFLKRAAQSPNYEGFEAGVVAIDKDGIMHERKGALTLPGDTLVGGWARVYRKNFKVPIEARVSLEEYNKKQSTWNSMPATMIRKTALDVLKETYGPDNVTGTLKTGIKIEVNSKELPTHSIVIDTVLKDNVLKRIVIPKGKVTEVGEITYKDGEVIGYPTTLLAFADGENNNTHIEYIKGA